MKYNTVIFDMDGVITSEQLYWDAAALTVWEVMHPETDAPQDWRNILFDNDRVITIMKERGVNSNWDLGYVALAFWQTDGAALYKAIADSDMDAFALYDEAAKLLADKLDRPVTETVRGGILWTEMRDIFQEWFLGSAHSEAFTGKPPKGNRTGLCSREEPIVGRAPLTKLLTYLHGRGVRLCIGTGRPIDEALSPLRLWNVCDLFDMNGIATYTTIAKAERETGANGLTKPNPYMFVKAFLGLDFSDEEIIAGHYPSDFSKCLIVGDAGADMFAAQNMPADFAAVLTGVDGAAAHSYFAENNATYIFNDVTEIAALWNNA